MERLISKSVIITGAGQGVGRAAALLMASEGANVALTDVDDDAGMRTLKTILKKEGKAAYWHLDVSDEKMVQKVFTQIYERFKNVNVLVNNASIWGTDKPTNEITSKDWDEVLNINLKGVFLCTKHVIPYMKEAEGGSIINISSVYGLIGAGDVPPYHASKGAVRSMTKNDAVTYAKDKIRVNSILPGFIWTTKVEKYLKSKGNEKEALKNLNSIQPLGHIGKPNDVAFGIIYLASDESAFVTGAELVIDGGYTAK